MSLLDLASMRQPVCCVQVQSKPPSHLEPSHLIGLPFLSIGVRSLSWNSFFQPSCEPTIHFTFLSRPILMRADWWREEMMIESSDGS